MSIGKPTNSLKGLLMVWMFFFYCGCNASGATYRCESSNTPWLLFRDSCYFFQHRESGIDWRTARTKCNERNAHLLDIRDLNEWNFVRNNTRGKLTWQYRIGMTDHETEGVWRFEDGSLVNFTKWAPNEPNRGDDENCGTLFGDTEKLGLYNDAPCGYKYSAYICKKGAIAEPMATTPPSHTSITGGAQAMTEQLGSTTSYFSTSEPIITTSPSGISSTEIVEVVKLEQTEPIATTPHSNISTTGDVQATNWEQIELKTTTQRLSVMPTTPGVVEHTSKQAVPTQMKPSPTTPAAIPATSGPRTGTPSSVMSTIGGVEANVEHTVGDGKDKSGGSSPPLWVVPLVIVVFLVILLVFVILGVRKWRRKRHHSRDLPSNKIPLTNVT